LKYSRRPLRARPDEKEERIKEKTGKEIFK